ncbi:MAG: sigma-70 family RNA polymerase sigma factor [Oscillibacter sp.]|nr:sigma-70 family RNA polymerase sigma factor [Oscillibacter sp.]
MTQEEREFAEQKHDLVIDYLRRKYLPMDDFYDIVIFGYLSAVQQYFRDPPAGVTFEAMAVRAMRDSILRDGEYRTRAKRSGTTVGLDDFGSTITDPRQDTERQVEGKALLEQAVSAATPQEARIINLLIDGFVLREAAQLLRIPKAAAVNCMESFCCRARATIN